MDEYALSYAEVKALAGWQPIYQGKDDLDAVDPSKTTESVHDSQRYELENKIPSFPKPEIRKCKEQIENATVDAATVKEHSVVMRTAKMFSVSSWKRKFTTKKNPRGKPC